jgi:hypothetical protein
MTRKERLRKEAIEGCNRRGHSMNRFKHDNTRASSTCKKCDMQVSITPLFSYEIIGEAVALDCNQL